MLILALSKQSRNQCIANIMNFVVSYNPINCKIWHRIGYGCAFLYLQVSAFSFDGPCIVCNLL